MRRKDELEKCFVDPPDWLVAEAHVYDIKHAADRAWIPSAWPADLQDMTLFCMCGGSLDYKRCPFVWADGKQFSCWLGQCGKCEHVLWAMEEFQ